MVILAILIIVYIMIGYGLFLNTLSEEYIKSVAKGNNRNILECKSAYSSSSSSSSQSK